MNTPQKSSPPDTHEPQTPEKQTDEFQARVEAAARKKAQTKYHGSIEVTPPGGKSIASGTRVLVAIRSLRFGNLPDSNSRNEVSLLASAETAADDDAESPIVSGQFETNHYRYVLDRRPLNLRDLVIFHGKVLHYLTIRCAIDEIEGTKFAETLPNLLPADSFPPYTLALGFLSNLLLLNSDDQVLRLNHSLYTAEAKLSDARTLQEGVYLLEKPAPAADDDAQVTAEIEIIPIKE